MYVDRWQIIRLIVVGLIFGICMSGVAVGYLFLAKAFYGLSDAAIRGLSFCVLFYFTMASLISVRERKFFWNSLPSWQLLVAVLGDSVVIFILAVVGIPPLDWPPIYFGWVFATIGAALISAIMVDFVKRLVFTLYRLYDRKVARDKEKAQAATAALK